MKYLSDKKEMISCIFSILLIIILIILPTGFEKQIYINSESAKAKVIEVNNDNVQSNGIIKSGNQVCMVEILTGEYKGEILEGMNLLSGKLESDKFFETGDRALVLIEKTSKNELISVNMLEHYRVNKIIILVGIFFGLLLLFAGKTGARTIISFILTIMLIWKLLIPLLLKGYNPIMIALVIGSTISILTLILVSGINKRSYCAIIGAITASIITCVLALYVGDYFKIDGVVMQWSESLLYTGFGNLDLTLIYKAGIYLSCSGAILDLAVDISAAIDEIVENNKNISKSEIIKSGYNIGKSVVGTQTTTLLLAYLGSFICVMMVYMAQGTPFINILNSQWISSEIVHTFVGCIGLVIVCPITTVVCGLVYSKNK